LNAWQRTSQLLQSRGTAVFRRVLFVGSIQTMIRRQATHFTTGIIVPDNIPCTLSIRDDELSMFVECYIVVGATDTFGESSIIGKRRSLMS